MVRVEPQRHTHTHTHTHTKILARDSKLACVWAVCKQCLNTGK